jgi:hypothetical protein
VGYDADVVVVSLADALDDVDETVGRGHAAAGSKAGRPSPDRRNAPACAIGGESTGV